jgi:hypothetical protein
MTAFETITGTTSMEFGVLIAAFITFWIIFFITKDLFIELLMPILMLFLGLIWLKLFIEDGLDLQVLLSTVMFFTGVYLLIRVSIQRLISAAKGEQP